MTGVAGDIIDQAIGWHMRQAEMTDRDWRAFVLWLEADPAHALAFDRIALDQEMVTRQGEMPATSIMVPANDECEPVRSQRRRWMWTVGGTAVAAGLVALVMPLAMPRASDPYWLQTKPGQRQDVALADGTRIEVSGGSRLKLDRSNPRVAALEAGEATFHVRHDDHDAFTLRSGDLTVRDLGTVFNVARDGVRLDVQVAEGAVLFQPDRDAVKLTPGTALSVREDSHSLALSHVAVDSVGGWRSGRVAFAGESLAHVADTIHRLYGTDLALDPGLSVRPFTGMVRLTGAAERDIPHLAALVGAGWRRDGERWTLSPREGDSR
ncbi:FecR family protein [Sphingomonas oligophenolica]|uniref:FecR domain-containing protein n=1 Tax=Sphingomonas oligophenolica TaxID=301154 RepID=A0ABU9Y5R3_9SPHN